jgi:hypothetical protein
MIHVMRAMPWTDAVIKLLEPRSPYRPWHGALSAEPGDAVLAILDTDPPSVIAEAREVDADGRADRAIAGCVDPDSAWIAPPVLLELATLTALTGMSYSHGSTEVIIHNTSRLVGLISERMWAHGNLSYLHGHTTLAAARILLESRGRCTGCECALDLANVNARYHVHIHTVDFDPTASWMPVAYDPTPEEPEPEPEAEKSYSADSIRLGSDRWRPIRIPPDWPAVLCDACHDRMRHDRFTSFLDFRFSFHPPCSSCSARWTLRTTAGFVAALPPEPWIRHTGCTRDQKWRCGACGHKWGGQDQPEVQ